jgi:hypothetical protein
MSAGFYATHFHSLVRWTRAFNDEMASQLETPINFINWDAHYEGQELPPVDLVGIADYSLAAESPENQVFVSWVISVWNDPDLTRQTDIVDALMDELRDGGVIPVWTMSGEVLQQESWMKAAGPVTAEPQQRDKSNRPYKVVTARLLSGYVAPPS